MSTEVDAEEYATEKGKELANILAGVSCEFATTATLTLTEAPKLLFKEGDSADFSTVTLVHDSEELEKQRQSKKIREEAANAFMYGRDPKKMINRNAALAEQMGRFESLRKAMPKASFGHGSKVSELPC